MSDKQSGAAALLEQMGGISGLIYSSLPVLVFVPVSSAFGLVPAIVAALAVATLILVWRLVRKESAQPAISGFMGVGICALMIFGFLLLATVSASLAALFVREEELPREEREDSAAQAVLASLHAIEHRLALLEGAIRSSPEDGVDAATTAGSSNGEETERGGFSLEPPA